MKIIVYTKPACTQCKYTIAELDKTGHTYETVDVTRDRDTEKDIRAMGFTTLPVVVVSYDNGEGEAWSGLKLDNIRSLRESEGENR